MDLHGFVCREVEHFRHVDLGDRALDGVLLHSLEGLSRRLGTVPGHICQPCVDHPRGAVHHRLACEYPHRHVRQLLADGPEVGDRLPERLALQRVRGRIRNRVLGPAHACGGQFQASHVEDVECDHVPASDLAEHVLDRHVDVVQVQRRCRAAAQSHLVLFGSRIDALERALDQERREVYAVDLREYRVQVRPAPVRDPHLLAVEHVVLAVWGEFGTRERVLRVAAGLRLAQAVGCQQFARDHARYVSPPLFLGSEENQRQCANAGVGPVGGRERCVAAHRLGYQHLRGDVQLEPVMPLRHEDAQQP